MSDECENSWEESSSDSEENENTLDEPATEVSRDNVAPITQSVSNQKLSEDSSSNGEISDGNSIASNGSDTSIHTNKKKITQDEKKLFVENPDVYGIRRSSRARKEPNRFDPKFHFDSDTDSDVGTQKKKKRKRQTDFIPTLSDSHSESGSDSSYSVPSIRRKKKIRNVKQNIRASRPRSDSSSDEDFAGKKYKSKKSAKVTHPATSSSTRISNKVSYKEDSEVETDPDDIVEASERIPKDIPPIPLEDIETIEKVMGHRYGRPGITGDQTTVYAVEKEELSMLGEPDPETDPVELQFLIKWKNWSHLHSTWESRVSLTTKYSKGIQKLDNYGTRLEEIEKWKMSANPEDVEYFNCQQEMNDDLSVQYATIERIIAHKFLEEPGVGRSAYPDYLCKWSGLPYAECSWEDGELVARFSQNHIDAYLERESSDAIPNKNTKCLRQRPQFVPFKVQPEFIGREGCELRDYQLHGLNWLLHSWCKSNSSILADEMGLGKTIQTISFLSCLFHSHQLYGPYLVVVPLSTIDNWQKEFNIWASEMNVIVYIGDVNSRAKIQEYEWCLKNRKLKFNVVLTTYEMLIRDKEVLGSTHWAALVVDEAHRLKNFDSLLYRILVDFHTNYRLLITGTPLQNSLKELWALMHFIMKNTFSLWEDFEAQFSLSEKDGYEKLHKELEPYLLRRDKKNVEKSLPAKVEQILRVEMSSAQKAIYKLILTKNITELSKELKCKLSGLLNIVVQLKKCCNHAHLMAPITRSDHNDIVLQTLIRGSGKMILLDKLLCRLKEKGHRVLIFSQMVRMLDIIAEYLQLKRFQFQRLDGGIRGDVRKRSLDHFNAEGSIDFCFLLSTRAGGLGINLATADVVIIFDSDWNPQNDIQAMARAHRIGQSKQVNIYRFVTKKSIEEEILDRAKRKMVLDHLVIQTMDTTGRRILPKSTAAPSSKTPFNREDLSTILKFGAEDLFKDQDGETDSKLEEMDIDDILQRAEMQSQSDKPVTMGEELLSQFKVVNYAAFSEDDTEAVTASGVGVSAIEKLWDEIIPAEEREKAEKEAEEERQRELCLPPRQRKRVNKLNVGHEDDCSVDHLDEKSYKPSRSRGSNKFKSNEFVESSASSLEIDDEENDTEEEITVKRKQIEKNMRKKGDLVNGFNDQEIKRFVQSYQKFAAPHSHLDAIAEDAGLVEKSSLELQTIADRLHNGCLEAIAKGGDVETGQNKKSLTSFKIAGVTVNAQNVLKWTANLDLLAKDIPSEIKQQQSYRWTIPTRNVHWGVSWSIVDDSMLLVGTIRHGFGNWDAIKNDQNLSLNSKILLSGNAKPQASHLQSRVEYLLRLLNQQQVEKSSTVLTKTSHKSRRKDRSESSIDNEQTGLTSTKKVDKKSNEKPEKKKKIDDKKKKEQKALKDVNLPADLISEESLPPPSISTLQADIVIKPVEKMNEAMFKECKDKMRAVKAALRLLERPEESTNEKDQVHTTKLCLLKIGDHIERCLSAFSTKPDKLSEWRSNLWSFVAKFTEFSASKLFALYRTAARKRDSHRQEKEKHIQKMRSEHSSSLQETNAHASKQSHPDRDELERARKRALGIDPDESVAPDRTTSSSRIPKVKRKKGPEAVEHNALGDEKMDQSHSYQQAFQGGHQSQVGGHRQNERTYYPGGSKLSRNSSTRDDRDEGYQHRWAAGSEEHRGHQDDSDRSRYRGVPYDEKPASHDRFHHGSEPDSYKKNPKSFNRRPRYDRDKPDGRRGSDGPPSNADGAPYDFYHSSSPLASKRHSGLQSVEQSWERRSSSKEGSNPLEASDMKAVGYIPYGTDRSDNIGDASRPENAVRKTCDKPNPDVNL